jgi:Predicted transcriptional regulator
MKSEPCEHCDGTGKQIDQRALGKELRSRRERANKTLRETAVAMGVSAPYVSDLELGRRHWNSRLIREFVNAIGK